MDLEDNFLDTLQKQTESKKGRPSRERVESRPTSRDDTIEIIGANKSAAFQANGLVWEKKSYTPDNGLSLSLDVDPKLLDPALHYAWINHDRVDEMLGKDYKIVPNVEKRYVGRIGNSEEHYGYAYLMCYPKEWYDEAEARRVAEYRKKMEQQEQAERAKIENSFSEFSGGATRVS